MLCRAKDKVAITTTCAANYLDMVPQGDPASGNKQSVENAFNALGEFLKRQPADCAREYLEMASDTCIPIVHEFAQISKIRRAFSYFIWWRWWRSSYCALSCR